MSGQSYRGLSEPFMDANELAKRAEWKRQNEEEVQIKFFSHIMDANQILNYVDELMFEYDREYS